MKLYVRMYPQCKHPTGACFHWRYVSLNVDTLVTVLSYMFTLGADEEQSCLTLMLPTHCYENRSMLLLIIHNTNGNKIYFHLGCMSYIMIYPIFKSRQ